MAIVVVTATVGAPNAAHAQAAGAGLLDGLQSNVQGAAGQWLTNALTYASELFGVVAVTMCAVRVVRYYATNNTWEGWHYPLSELVFRLIVPFILLKTAATFLPNVFAFAGRLATGITGVPISGPTAIFALGMERGGNLYWACTGPLFTYLASTNPIGAIAGSVAGSIVPGGAPLFANTPQLNVLAGLAIIGCIAAFIIIVAFAFIAAELLLASLNVLITLSIGAVQLGWSAAPATEQMASAYWSSVNMAIFRVVIIYAIASFISTSALTAFSILPNANDTPGMFKETINALAFACASFYIVIKLPHLAENAFSGRASFAANEVAQHAQNMTRAAVSLATRGVARA